MLDLLEYAKMVVTNEGNTGKFYGAIAKGIAKGAKYGAKGGAAVAKSNNKNQLVGALRGLGRGVAFGPKYELGQAGFLKNKPPMMPSLLQRMKGKL